MAATSPGSGWTNNTKGSDCDDTNASKTTDCGTQTPTTTPCTNKTVCSVGYSLVKCDCVKDVPLPDPCAEIKKALADAKFKEMLVNLKDPKKLDLNNETGTFQAKDGNYYPMEVFEGQPGVFVPSGSGPAQNINHVHTKQFTDANGVHKVFPMPSPTDIATIYTDYHFVRSMGTDPGNNYSGTINSLGYFQLRYTGQADNLSWEQLKAKRDLIDTYENGEIFKALAKKHDNDMLGFLIFMRDTLKITDIALYKVDDTGAKKIELDANNQIKETPCNK